MISSAVRPLSKEITMSQAYQNMCAGMYKVHTAVPQHHCCADSNMLDCNSTLSACLQTMVALDMDGKVRRPQFELDSEQVRYEHRFAPFNSVVTPPPVHYIQFKVLEESHFWHFNSFFCFCVSQTPVSLPGCHPSCPLQEMSDLKKYNPPPGSSDLYLAASKHFQQAKLILENVLGPDPEVRPCLSLVPFCCFSS